MKDVVDWLVIQSLEPVSIFSEVLAYRLFAGPVKQQLLMFLPPNDDSHREANQKYLQEMRKAAAVAQGMYRSVEEKVLMAVVYWQEDHYDLMAAYGVYGLSQTPRVVMSQVNQEVGSVDKYLFDKDSIESEHLVDFIQEVRGQEVDVYLKSEEPGQTLELEPLVIKATGSDYVSLVKENKDNVVVLYCSLDVQFARICDPAVYVF